MNSTIFGIRKKGPATQPAPLLHWVLGVVLVFISCASTPPGEPAHQDIDPIEQAHTVRGRGEPVVVFESGLGETIETWKSIYPHVSRLSTVLLYNRLGYDHGDDGDENEMLDLGVGLLGSFVPGGEYAGLALDALNGVDRLTASPNERSGNQIVEELRRLLNALNLSPPYILVGHQAGGLYMTLFAKRYPDDVAGVVLIDAHHYDQTRRLGASTVAHFSRKLAEEPLRSEYLNLAETETQVKASSHFPDVPLKVISRGRCGALESSAAFGEWMQLQKELALLSGQGKHVISEKTSAEILSNDPELVVAMIASIIRRVSAANHASGSSSTGAVASPGPGVVVAEAGE